MGSAAGVPEMTFLLFSALTLTLLSGVTGLFFPKGRPAGQWVCTILHLAGCAAGIVATLFVFSGNSLDARFVWPVPGGTVLIHVDALSAFFLVPVFLVMGAGSIYGHGYWSESEQPATGRKLRLFYGTLTAGLSLVMIAGDAWSFLFGWELTGLSAFFLVNTERDKPEALRAGWIYLIATHVATLVLFAMFGAFQSATGVWTLNSVVPSASPLVRPILILALAGFGIKAGLMPFHFWLPEAHAAAPSHVSAMLSGVVLKMGVYGLIRMITIVPVDRWFGEILLFAGILSGVLGVVFALAQHDLKRLLAYHSIENIGIIFIGIGASILGQNQSWGALALAGAELHVWNHAFFKALLFFSAGSVVHATGTRSIDELGGLLPKAKTTAIAFLIGAVAICGLPPLNGFVSEWLVYLSGFHAAAGSNGANAAMLAVPALALIGGLAIACFVKAFSVVFLGHPRSERAQHPHEERSSMRVAMLILCAACFVIGVWPLAVLHPLSAATAVVAGGNFASAEMHTLFGALPVASVVALALIALGALAITIHLRKPARTVTWDCGYAAPNKRMQYTASSFAAPIVALFQWVLHPDIHKPAQTKRFPDQASFHSHVPDPMLDRFLIPQIARSKRLMAWAHFIQAGRIQIYILYVVATLLILLAWSFS